MVDALKNRTAFFTSVQSEFESDRAIMEMDEGTGDLQYLLRAF